jgi:putative sigma-54 modulation protein
MNIDIQISGHHIQVTEALREYVHKKFQKIQDQMTRITQIHITLSVEKADQNAEAQVHLPGKTLHGTATHTDLYTAIDNLAAKIHTQAIKYKEKLTDHKVKTHDLQNDNANESDTDPHDAV